MALTTSDKRQIIEEYREKETDTGSAEVQVALLTERIKYLTEHLKVHKKDHSSRRGPPQARRSAASKLLRFVRNRSEDRYKTLIGRLGIRR